MEYPIKMKANLDMSQLENQENHEIEGFDFSEMGTVKIDALKNSIKEINEMIKGREILSHQIHSEGEAIKTEINGYLKENERLQIADGNPMVEKNSLRHKKIEISEAQMNEKIGCWKDIALLKKELREYERELTEKEERSKMLKGILEESK